MGRGEDKGVRLPLFVSANSCSSVCARVHDVGNNKMPRMDLLLAAIAQKSETTCAIAPCLNRVDARLGGAGVGDVDTTV